MGAAVDAPSSQAHPFMQPQMKSQSGGPTDGQHRPQLVEDAQLSPCQTAPVRSKR